MLHFAPGDEQEEVRKLAASLAIQELRPLGRQAEKVGDIPSSLLQTLAQTGLTAPFPEEYGGSGPIEAVTYTLITEELAFGDGGLASNVIGSLIAPTLIAQAGNDSQKQQYLPAFASAEHNMPGSLAFAEPGGGYSIAEIQAQVRPDGNEYLVNGAKRAVIHGARAGLRIILTRLVGSSGTNGICAFTLPEEIQGLTINPDQHRLGMQAAPSASLALEQVRLPESTLIGQAGDLRVLRTVALYNILRAALACGIARASFEYARDYAKERTAFGRPIASYQGIAFIVAESAMKLDAARLLTWRAAASWNGQQEIRELVRQAEAAQRQAVKIAQRITTDAVQVLGGAGFIQDHPVEMWMRDAAAME